MQYDYLFWKFIFDFTDILLSFFTISEDLAITLQPELEVTVDEGGKFSLMCEATGFPYPIYVWFHGDKKLSIQQDGRLTIDQARSVTSSPFSHFTCCNMCFTVIALLAAILRNLICITAFYLFYVC